MWAMTAGVEHHEMQQMGADAVSEHVSQNWRATRVLGASDDQRWAGDAAEVGAEVERFALALEELNRNVNITDRSFNPCRVLGHLMIEWEADTAELCGRRLCSAGEIALGDHPCFPAAVRLKGVDYRLILKHGRGAIQDEL